MEEIAERIAVQVNQFIKAVDMSGIDRSSRSAADMLVMLNNSFPFRDKIQTKKSDLYLAAPLAVTEVNAADVYVVKGKTTTADFSRIKKADAKLSIWPLAEQIQSQISSLGKLVFILIGKIDDSVIHEVEISDSNLHRMIVDPTLAQPVRVADSILHVRSLEDVAQSFTKIENTFDSISDEEKVKLREAVLTAYRKLRSEVYARLSIPSTTEPGVLYFLDKTVEALTAQVDEYSAALQTVSGATEMPVPTEVLRIAYNFTDDALKLIRVLVSVCDLKPIVLWGTIYSHYQLSEAIKNLPWSGQTKKPKLSDYREQIAKARNKAFHRLFSFDKAFEVQVPDDSIDDIRFRFFSEFSGARNTANSFSFRDKALIDVLMEFSRTSEESVDLSFWQRNLEVMRATTRLVADTSEFLKLLLSASQGDD